MFSTATSRCCPGPAQSCPRPRPRLRCRPTRPRCGRLASPAAPPAWLRLTSGSAALRQSWPPWFLRRDSRVLATGWSWRLTAVLTVGAQSLTVSEPNYCANSWSWAAKRYANSWSSEAHHYANSEPTVGHGDLLVGASCSDRVGPEPLQWSVGRRLLLGFGRLCCASVQHGLQDPPPSIYKPGTKKKKKSSDRN